MFKLFVKISILSLIVISILTLAACESKDKEKKHGPEGSTFKLLAIGNSFSEDSVTYLYEVVKSQGFEDIIIGSIAIGGCSLKMHANNIKENSPNYIYIKDTSGKRETLTSTSTLYEGLVDEEWDYIVVQQVSGYSGDSDSYSPYLEEILGYLQENKSNPTARIAWHMTWAYQGDSNHSDFAKYANDQMTMYKEIVNTLKKKVLTNKDISFIIPTGTAIQNARTSWVGDSLTRDGYHMSLPFGRFLASMTWYCAVTQRPIEAIETDLIEDEYIEVALEAINAAIKDPYKVTPSKIKERPKSTALDKYNLDDYLLIDWEAHTYSYYNSSEDSNLRTNNSSTFNAQYIASKIFTREDLPIGSLIVIDPDYQYRPEGWLELGKATSPRPGVTTKALVEVSESWWGEYKYRAFNFSKQDNANISRQADSHIEKLKIYVPK